MGYGSTLSESETTIAADLVVVHPYYNYFENHDYDIAVIFFEKSLNFSSKVQPVKLPEADDIAKPGEMMIVSGWGKTNSFGSGLQSKLRETKVPILDLKTCRKLYGGLLSYEITNQMICAGYMNGGKI